LHEVFRFLNVSASILRGRGFSTETPVGANGGTDVGGRSVIGSKGLLVEGSLRGALVKVEARARGVRRTAGTSLGRTESSGAATDVRVLAVGLLVGHGG